MFRFFVASSTAIILILSTSSTPAFAGREAEEKALAAAPAFTHYFKSIQCNLREREYLIKLARIALIAKEHLLLMGPPGNAKSKFSDDILGHIVNEKGESSYYKIQMTPETTLSETHGPLDYKTLTETNVYARQYGEGMLMSRNGFIDEIFDARPNARRNILGLLNERAHAQGPRIQKGLIETVFAATNKYISEVYEEAGNDQPKALLDRFAFSAFVPSDFQNIESALYLIQNGTEEEEPIPPLSFQQLDAIRALANSTTIAIPKPVAQMLALLHLRLKEQLESIEQLSLKTYLEKQRNGEKPNPPYRATKYLSLRTLKKASIILRALVVNDWIEKGGKRKLEANFDDLKELVIFFTLNGPNHLLEDRIARSSHPYEKGQFEAILQERAIYRRIFEEIMKERNNVIVPSGLVDLQAELIQPPLPHEKEAMKKRIMTLLLDARSKMEPHTELARLNGTMIGREEVEGVFKSIFQEHFGDPDSKEFSPLKEEIKSERRMAMIRKEEESKAKLLDEQQKELLLPSYYLESKNFSSLGARQEGNVHSPKYFHQAIPGTTDVLLYNPHLGQFSIFQPEKVPNIREVQKSKKLEKIISKSKEAIEDILVPDNQHMLVFSKRHIHVFNLDTGDHERSIEFTSIIRAKYYRLSEDRKNLIRVEPLQNTVTQYNWKTGVVKEMALVNQIRNSKDLRTTQDVLLQMSYKEDALILSKKKDSIYFTANKMRELYELDLLTGNVEFLNNHNLNFTFKYVNQDHLPNKIYGLDIGNSIRIIEIDLYNSFKTKIHHIVPFSNMNPTGLAVLENGLIALMGTELYGMVYIDLMKDKVMSSGVYGISKKTYDPKVLDNNRVGFWNIWDYVNSGESLYYRVTQKLPYK